MPAICNQCIKLKVHHYKDTGFTVEALGSAYRSRANTYRILHTVNVSDSDDMYG